MKIAAVVSTKGGPGKTMVGANLGAFCAGSGVRTLLIDLDNRLQAQTGGVVNITDPVKRDCVLRNIA